MKRGILKGSTLAYHNRNGYLSPKQVAIFFGKKNGGSVDVLMEKYGVKPLELDADGTLYRLWKRDEVEAARLEYEKLSLFSAIEKDGGREMIERIERIEARLMRLELAQND